MRHFICLAITIVFGSCSISNTQSSNESGFSHSVNGVPSPINNSKELQIRDSLVRQIDLATTATPSNLTSTILIVETYDYQDWLKLFDDKYTINKDSRTNRKSYRTYKRKQKKLHPPYEGNKIYATKGEYDHLDANQYRYVLRTTSRFTEKRTENSISATTNLIFFIVDRQTNEVFKGLGEWKVSSWAVESFKK